MTAFPRAAEIPSATGNYPVLLTVIFKSLKISGLLFGRGTQAANEGRL